VETHLVHVFLQYRRVDKRNRGLLHAEEDMLDTFCGNGANPIPFRKGALQQQAGGAVVFATAVVVRLSHSSSESPGSSIQARKDKAAMCFMTRYVLLVPSLKTPLARIAISALQGKQTSILTLRLVVGGIRLISMEDERHEIGAYQRTNLNEVRARRRARRAAPRAVARTHLSTRHRPLTTSSCCWLTGEPEKSSSCRG
jgi:hypothetical protein